MRSNQSEKETIIQWAVGGILLVGCLLAGYKITSIGFVGLQAPGSSSGTPTSSNVADGFVGLQAPGSSSGTPTSSNVADGFVGLQAPGSSSGTPTSSNVAEKSWCLGVKEQGTSKNTKISYRKPA
jgi:hypothetical protein